MIQYAVFHQDRQLRVFPDVIGADVAFNKAKQMADQNHVSGYPCTIEEFSFSSIIGVLVYNTESNN